MPPRSSGGRRSGGVCERGARPPQPNVIGSPSGVPGRRGPGPAARAAPGAPAAATNDVVDGRPQELADSQPGRRQGRREEEGRGEQRQDDGEAGVDRAPGGRPRGAGAGAARAARAVAAPPPRLGALCAGSGLDPAPTTAHFPGNNYRT